MLSYNQVALECTWLEMPLQERVNCFSGPKGNLWQNIELHLDEAPAKDGEEDHGGADKNIVLLQNSFPMKLAPRINSHFPNNSSY